MTKYQISKAKWSLNKMDFGEGMLPYGKGEYGMMTDPRCYDLPDEHLNSIFEENEEFVRSAEEEGYDTSFEEMSAMEVYTKMTGDDEETFWNESDDNFYEAIQPFYDNFKDQAGELKKYLEEDERINILEDNCRDELDANYVIECDDEAFKELKGFIDKSNTETENKNNISTIHEYTEKKFNTPVFKVVFSNAGSLEVEIE